MKPLHVCGGGRPRPWTRSHTLPLLLRLRLPPLLVLGRGGGGRRPPPPPPAAHVAPACTTIPGPWRHPCAAVLAAAAASRAVGPAPAAAVAVAPAAAPAAPSSASHMPTVLKTA